MSLVEGMLYCGRSGWLKDSPRDSMPQTSSDDKFASSHQSPEVNISC